MTLHNKEGALMGIKDYGQFAEEFYSRQVILKEFGKKGQRKLGGSKVAVVGVGGLGSVSSLYLALAGVGFLRVIDQDILETKNLHRQILYTRDDVDYPKAEVAAARLEKLNPLVKVEAFSDNVNVENVDRLLAGVDVVVDGLDNMSTRYLINRVCVKRKIPYVFGGAIGMEGNISVFNAPKTPCLECLFPNLSDNELTKCDTRGVLGVTPGIIGAMQAFETIKVLTGVGTPLLGKLMICDFTDMSFTTIDVVSRPNCEVCKGISPPTLQEKLVWLCGHNTANINPEMPLRFSFDSVNALLHRDGHRVRVKSRFALVFDFNGLEVSLFKGGRMLIKNVVDEKSAIKAYRDILRTLKIEK